jgi:hypothetical protein
VIRYADDTLEVVPAESSQLEHLKFVLQSFATSTGLNINFEKYFLVPINVDERWYTLTSAMGCE